MAEAAAAGGASMGAGGYFYAAGTIMQMMAARAQGRMARIQGEQARVAAQFNARQAERDGATAIAVSHRQAAEERRQANLVASRALAVAAASGAGVSDPTVMRLISSARGEGAYRASVALYEGAARDRQLRLDAVLGRVSGFQAESAGAREAEGAAFATAGTGLRGVGSLYAKYGMNGPGSGDTALINQDTRSAEYPDL